MSIMRNQTQAQPAGGPLPVQYQQRQPMLEQSLQSTITEGHVSDSAALVPTGGAVSVMTSAGSSLICQRQQRQQLQQQQQQQQMQQQQPLQPNISQDQTQHLQPQHIMAQVAQGQQQQQRRQPTVGQSLLEQQQLLQTQQPRLSPEASSGYSTALDQRAPRDFLQILRDRYFQDMRDLLTMLTHGSTQVMPPEHLQKLQHYKDVSHRMIPYLSVPKEKVPIDFNIDKVETFERQIVNIMGTFKKRKRGSQGQHGQQVQQGQLAQLQEGLQGHQAQPEQQQ